MSICDICPRECSADRSKDIGFCGVGDSIKIAKAALHMWEEPCISGENGSGTVFFSGCSLGCVFCQNTVISHGAFGKDITAQRLEDIFYELKDKGAHNINLVTGDHFAVQIIPVIKKVKKQGFDLPFILNTSSYIKEQTLSEFSGVIDIYIADMKFFSADTAKKYANAPDYPEIAKKAIDLMVKCTEKQIAENGIMKKGVIVRVLVLPNNILDAKLSVKYLLDKYADEIFLSVMGQYTPAVKSQFHELNRNLTDLEYKSVVDFAVKHGCKNGFAQQKGSDDLKYIPAFDLEGV